MLPLEELVVQCPYGLISYCSVIKNKQKGTIPFALVIFPMVPNSHPNHDSWSESWLLCTALMASILNTKRGKEQIKALTLKSKCSLLRSYRQTRRTIWNKTIVRMDLVSESKFKYRVSNLCIILVCVPACYSGPNNSSCVTKTQERTVSNLLILSAWLGIFILCLHFNG